MTGPSLIPFWYNLPFCWIKHFEQRLILRSLIGFRDLDLEFRVP